jgi:hypothetical protein
MLSGISFAQQVPESYQKAKSVFSSGDFSSAIGLFKEFLVEEKYGNLSYYAAFHTAEAALNVNQPALAVISATVFCVTIFIDIVIDFDRFFSQNPHTELLITMYVISYLSKPTNTI